MSGDGAGSAAGGDALAERVARVVAVADGVAWLEPEATKSCSGCLSLSSCGFKGDGKGAMESRRFPLITDQRLRIGERVVVGLPESAVLRASATAYGIPLASMVAAALIARGLGAGDGVGALALLGGLGAGFGLARLAAARLAARGDLAPQLLRRVAAGGACGQN